LDDEEDKPDALDVFDKFDMFDIFDIFDTPEKRISVLFWKDASVDNLPDVHEDPESIEYKLADCVTRAALTL
jgi:hypothetical protein